MCCVITRHSSNSPLKPWCPLSQNFYLYFLSSARFPKLASRIFKTQITCLSNNNKSTWFLTDIQQKHLFLAHQQQKHVVFDRSTMTIPFCFRRGWLVHSGRSVSLLGSISQGCSPTSRESQCWSTSATKGTNSIKWNIQLPDIWITGSSKYSEDLNNMLTALQITDKSLLFRC